MGARTDGAAHSREPEKGSRHSLQSIESLENALVPGTFRASERSLDDTPAPQITEILDKVKEGRPVSLPARIAHELSERGLIEQLSDRRFRDLKREYEGIKEVHKDRARETKNYKEAAAEVKSLRNKTNSFLHRTWMKITFRSDQLEQEHAKLKVAKRDVKRAKLALSKLEPAEDRLREIGEQLSGFTPSTAGYLNQNRAGDSMLRQLRQRPKNYEDLNFGEAKLSADRWSSLIRRTRHGIEKEGLPAEMAADLAISSVGTNQSLNDYIQSASRKRKNMSTEVAARLVVAAHEAGKDSAGYIDEYRKIARHKGISAAAAAHIAIEVLEKGISREAVLENFDAARRTDGLDEFPAALLACCAEKTNVPIDTLVKYWRLGWEVDVDANSAAIMATAAAAEQKPLASFLNAWFEAQKLPGCDSAASTRMAIASVVNDIPMNRFLVPWRRAVNLRGATADSAAQLATLSVSSRFDLDLLMESYESAVRISGLNPDAAARLACYSTGADIEQLPSMKSLKTFDAHSFSRASRQYDPLLAML